MKSIILPSSSQEKEREGRTKEHQKSSSSFSVRALFFQVCRLFYSQLKAQNSLTFFGLFSGDIKIYIKIFFLLKECHLRHCQWQVCLSNLCFHHKNENNSGTHYVWIDRGKGSHYSKLLCHLNFLISDGLQ